MMSEIRYSKDHEYIRVESGEGVVGISDYAQKQLGDVVFAETPPVGKVLKKGDPAAVVESVKAASDVFAPVSGQVLAVNSEVESTPGLINEDALGRGWLFRVGVPDIGALFADIPVAKRIQGLLEMPLAKSEMAVERAMTTIANRSIAAGSVPFFLGSGAYRRHIPATVAHLIQRSEFLTSYTPYQPEIAQGTLQVLFEFQTQVAALTGMDVANASMYDGSTACAEAVMMATRVPRRSRAVLSGGLHPHYAGTVQTMANA